MGVVTYKDEGAQGRARYFQSRERMSQLEKTFWPLGTTPEGVLEMGWMSRSKAVRQAKAIGAEFEEV